MVPTSLGDISGIRSPFLLYSTGSHIQSRGIDHNRRKGMYNWIDESLCCTSEIGTTLQISFVQRHEIYNVSFSSVFNVFLLLISSPCFNHFYFPFKLVFLAWKPSVKLSLVSVESYIFLFHVWTQHGTFIIGNPAVHAYILTADLLWVFVHLQ